MLTIDTSLPLALASPPTTSPPGISEPVLFHEVKCKLHPRTRPHVATPHFDTDGTPIVKVRFNKGRVEVRMFPEDFQLLADKGFYHGWRAFPARSNLQEVRVVFSVRGRGQQSLSLRRIIMGAGKGEIVRVRDGNPLNLRRDNLILDRGFGPNIQLFPRPNHP